MRSGIKQLLTFAGDIAVTVETTNGAEMLQKLRSGPFDLLLLDMGMPGITGIDRLARIRLYGIEVPILVLSMRNEAQIVGRALSYGANGYLTKNNEPEAMVAAIRTAAAGNHFNDPLLVDEMAFRNELGQVAPREHLSDR